MADENYDMMDDESAPPTSEDASVANDTNDTKADNKSDETEDQLALVPKHFFKDQPKPGDREMVEVIEVYEGEVSVKCVYGDKDDKDKDDDDNEENDSDSDDEEDMYSASSPSEAEEDEMMV